MIGILKEQEPLLYIYKVLKENRLYPAHRVGEWIETAYDGLPEELYRKVGTYRRAFVGDMQTKLVSDKDLKKYKRWWKKQENSVQKWWNSLPKERN